MGKHHPQYLPIQPRLNLSDSASYHIIPRTSGLSFHHPLVLYLRETPNKSLLYHQDVSQSPRYRSGDGYERDGYGYDEHSQQLDTSLLYYVDAKQPRSLRWNVYLLGPFGSHLSFTIGSQGMEGKGMARCRIQPTIRHSGWQAPEV